VIDVPSELSVTPHQVTKKDKKTSPIGYVEVNYALNTVNIQIHAELQQVCVIRIPYSLSEVSERIR
jgi:hypothetical protein